MKIKSINVINGKNKWSESKDKLIHMILDLGEFEEKPSDKIEGFYERIKEYLPSLKSHRCSEGKPGGFFKRIKDGTWMGHIIEHVALELQTLAGMNTGWGRTRGVKGQKGVYNVVFNYENEDIGKLAAREAFNVVTDIINDRDPKIDRIVKKLKPKRNLQESIRRILKEKTDSIKNLNESKTSQHLKLMNNLLDPFKEKDCLCDIKISFDVEENYYDIYLVFSQKELHEKFFNLYGIRSYIQKMMNEVKMELESFLPIRNIFIGNYTKPNCEWSPLNESEESKQERKFTKLLNNIQEYLNSNSYDSVVRFMVDYDEVMDDVIVNIFFDAEHAVKLGGGINRVIKSTGKKIMEDLSVFPFDFKYHIHFERPQLNESEDDKEKKIQKNLRAIRQLLDTIDVDGLCEMLVEYNPEDGDYEIRSKTTVRYYDMADMAQELGYIEDTIRSWKLKTYVFSPYYVENCEDEIEYLNESENKKSGLLRAIEEDGLYEVITSTSLHIHEIEQKVGQLSREVLERFIIDVVKEHHSVIDEDGQTYYIYLEDYPFNEVPVGNNDYVEQLKVTNNELLFVVSLYEEDKYGELEFTGGENISSNNLEYDNIYEIAGQMGFLLSKGLI